MSSRGIAITAAACRFPGSPDADAFWRLLIEARDAIVPIPSSRWDQKDAYAPWPGVPGRTYADRAGLIADIDRFDAGFFGIAPREADQMDPQQRVLLETACEALDAAGETRSRLAGSRTGVYVGISSVDYGRIAPPDPLLLDIYAATGKAASIAANRLSYVFDLRGPSLAVDTACSSSLVALHTACRALEAGDIDMAVVGGVNTLLASDLMIAFSAARMLAPDGRCKTFDARADGYVRGEGCGVIVLKRLADLDPSDPVIAVVRGSACNQDGRSNGLTAPNGQAQQAVIAAALADAGLSSGDIDAIELHGTGTALGDPIEAHALAAAVGGRRPDGRPVLVGSVKTNIGHLEAAAGIASLIKAALALQNRELPASLNFEEANPGIPLDDLGLSVPTAAVSLPGPIARIGVSGFGFGGTNAHAILETAPPRPISATAAGIAPWILPLSAHSEAALRALAGDWARKLREATAESLGDLAYTASVRRTHFDWRLAIVGADIASLAARLEAFAVSGQAAEGILVGRRRPAGPGRIALSLGPLDVFGGSEGEELGRRFGVLRTTLVLAGPSASSEAALLAAIAAEIKGWGIDISGVAGRGCGEPVARWFRSEIPLGDALGGQPFADETPILGKGTKLLAIGQPPEAAEPAFALRALTADSLATLAAALYADGHDLDWSSLQPAGRVVGTPPTPWQRQRHWLPGTTAMAADPVSDGITYSLDWRPLAGSAPRAVLQRLDAICAGFSLAAFEELGWRPGDSAADIDGLCARLRIAPGRRPAFARLVERLVACGELASDHASRFLRPADRASLPDPAAALDVFLADAPDLQAELELLGRTGSALAAVLRGDTDPLALLFPAGDLGILQRLYRDSPAARGANQLLAEVVRTAASALPKQKRLRILEVGAGTGGSTTAILDVVGDRETEYVFTDQSDHFLAAARTGFAGRPVTCRRLDIEQPPGSQGFEDESFDLVVAANVLHATRSLRETLRHCRSLLRPNGALVLLETTAASWPMELTFGLTDGWSRFEDDDLRPGQPLLGSAEWLSLLRETGFSAPAGYPCDSHGQQTVILAMAENPEQPPVRWLVRCGDPELGNALVRSINAQGHSASLAASSALQSLLEPTPGSGPAVMVDVFVPGRGAADACADAVRSIQLCASAGARYCCVTVNALGIGDDAPDSELAALWGLGRSAAQELPHVWAGLLDAQVPEADLLARAILACATNPGQDREFALRDGGLLTPILCRHDVGPPMAPLDSLGTFLITGGLGAVGLQLADWLAASGARHVVLVSRSAPTRAQEARIAGLRAQGITVEVTSADISRPDVVRDLVARLAAAPHPLRGVIHAAGLHEDGLVIQLSEEDVRRVMGAKAEGALALDLATRQLPLQLFILVSSAAAVAGMPGAGCYTAANAVLDAIAQSRRALGLPGTSAAFGPLSGLGMETRVPDRERRRWESFGVRTTAAEQAFLALSGACAMECAHVLIFSADWRAVAAGLQGHPPPPLLAGLLGPVSVAAIRADAPAPATPASDLLKQYAKLFPAERMARLQAVLSELAAGILRLPDGMLPDAERGLQDQGMDSLMALELHGKLQSMTGLRLPATLLIETPNLRALARDIARRLELPTEPPRAGAGTKPVAVAPSVLHVPPTGSGLDDTVEVLAALSEQQALEQLLALEPRG